MIAVTMIVISIGVILYVDYKCVLKKEIFELKDQIAKLNSDISSNKYKLDRSVKNENMLKVELDTAFSELALYQRLIKMHNIDITDINIENRNVIATNGIAYKYVLGGARMIDGDSMKNGRYIFIDNMEFKPISAYDISDTKYGIRLKEYTYTNI